MFRCQLLLVCVVGLLATPRSATIAQVDPATKDKPVPEPKLVANKGKPLTSHGRSALDFLVKQQQANGGWNSGPSAAAMEGMALPVVGGKQPKKPTAGKDTDPFDVANTSIAALALMRAGYTPKSGAHSEALRKAIAGVLKSVEASDKKTLSVTERTGTQVQRKIGDNADTYLAAIMLATARGKMPDERSEARLDRGLHKIVEKMTTNQKEDGTWNGAGWAPVLSQALASKAINMAKQIGMKVDKAVLDKTAKHAKETFKAIADAPGASKGAKGTGVLGMAAGVDLYAAAAAISALQDAVNTHRALGVASKSVLRSANALDLERKEAKLQLEELDEWEKALRDALKVMVKKVKDNKFVQGFGSDGGEEFLSFWLIGKALKLNELKEFGEWDKMLADRLSKSQNANGSFSGKHCITGETFCASTALLTMMADRAPRPEDAMQFVRAKNLGTTSSSPPTTSAVETRPDLTTPGPASASESELLLKSLLKTLDEDRPDILAKLRDGKGGDYTDALARGAGKLTGEAQKDTRKALAQRLARMNAKTLRGLLQDEDLELRRAAAQACGLKEDKQYIPDLIALLTDAEPMVLASAHSALKQLSGQDFGPEPNAETTDKTKAVLAWRKWWNAQPK